MRGRNFSVGGRYHRGDLGVSGLQGAAVLHPVQEASERRKYDEVSAQPEAYPSGCHYFRILFQESAHHKICKLLFALAVVGCTFFVGKIVKVSSVGSLGYYIQRIPLMLSVLVWLCA